MKKKQLHIVNKYFYPVLAGIEMCLLETYGRFDKNEWDITVHTSADTLSQANVLPENASYKNMAIRRYKTNYGSFFPDIPWNTADVVLLNNFSLSPVLNVLAHAFIQKLYGLTKAKVVLAPHGGFTPNWSTFSSRERIIKQFLHRYPGRFLINHTVSAVHSVAEWEKDVLIQAGIRKDIITVIPNGVEDIAFVNTPTVDPSTKKLARNAGTYILQIGRIHPLKNYEVAVRALKRVPEHVQFLIMGDVEDAAYYEKLKSLIRQLRLQRRVHFIGAVSGANKFYLIRKSRMMVHMAKFEVDSLVVKEALSQGIVCIGADNTGISYQIRDGVNGFLIPTFDDQLLSKKINYVLTHKHSKNIIGIKLFNLEHRDNYRWSNVSAKLELMFNNILPSRWSLSY